MFRRHVAVVLASVAGVFVLAAARSAEAGVAQPPPLTIVSQSVRVDQIEHEASFTILFNHTPDFSTKDALGRRADSFQYEIAPGTANPSTEFLNVRAVIRGDEMDGSRLPVRAGFQATPDPSSAAGGWGMVLGNAPFHLEGTQLKFSAPLSLLDSPDGLFAYRVFTTRYGATTSQATGSTAIPLPPALWTGLAMLMLLYTGSRAYEKRARPSAHAA